MITLAMALARAWTRLYTRGVRPECAVQRRAEIESDLFEQCRDSHARRHAATALAIAGRVALGARDDLAWRRLHRRPHGAPARARSLRRRRA